MRSLCLCLLLALASQAPAFGGSPLGWLSGTQAWDTTPVKEVDFGFRSSFGDGLTKLGAEAQVGIVDTLQAAIVWDQRLQDGVALGELRAQWREPLHPRWRPALALIARAPYDGQAFKPMAGLVLAVEPWDWSLTTNAEVGDALVWSLRGAVWTPYLLPMLRAGAEVERDPAAALWVTPQALVNAWGDISLMAGARLDGSGALPPRWMLRIAYQIFPSP